MGLGLLFAGLSGAGKSLASSYAEDERLSREEQLMRERSRLEEERMLRIEEARRVAQRKASIQQGQEISAGAALLQTQRNQTDADRINAENANVIGGSNMSAVDAATLRNAPPEARKAYGLLASSRQTDLEDRATAAENLGYLDAAKETRGLLQTEIQNQRYDQQSAENNRRLDMQEKRFDAQEKRAAEQLAAQISHWKSMEARAGGDPATQTLAKLKLAEFQMQSQWHAELAKTPVGSPERAALIQKGRDYEWIKEPTERQEEVTTSVKSIDEQGNEITTTTKGKPQPKQSSKTGWDSTSGDVYKNGKVIGNTKSEADARKLVSGNQYQKQGGTVPNPVAQEDKPQERSKSPKDMATGTLDKAIDKTVRELTAANNRGDTEEASRLNKQLLEQQRAKKAL